MISQRLTQASLPIISSPPTFLSPAMPVYSSSSCNHTLFNLTALAGFPCFSTWKIPIYHLNITSSRKPSLLSHFYILNIVLLILPSKTPSNHPSYRYVLTTSLCQTGTSMLHLSCTGLPVWMDLFEVSVGLRHVCASSTQCRV